ncbi:MAG TPA: dihydrofolate reductase family protein [Acidobacteriaceae bacterium]|nr:dihydrofolate reductase family protein [Acidobacteriaceae bacterium]
MSKVRVAAFSISIDGFGAGSEQSLSNPMGNRGMELHKWFMPTRTFHQMTNNSSPGTEGVDDSFAAKSFDNLGAWILGRNMFGPVRGPWPDDSWKGWWGDTPPYHVPVFVLTHYPRAPLTMNGGTTFHFVTDGIDSALAQARQAAAGKDVRIGGGVSTIRQYLLAGHIDELHIAQSPVLLGKGENLFSGIDLPSLGYATTSQAQGEQATHLTIRRD